MSFLNKKIVSLEPEIFGLDLSELSLKIIKIEGDDSQEVISSFVAVDIPAGNIEDGKIINKEVVAGIIKEAVKKAGPNKIKTNKVICSLPESKVFLRIVSIPAMNKEEAAEAIKWEMEASIPIPIEQAYFDWQILNSVGKKENVLTVAVAKEVVDDLMEVLTKAGLEVYGMEVESIASVRSLIKWDEEEKRRGALIVDLGEQRTSFIMIKNGVPSFTSSIPFSSESINDAISKGLNIDATEAEKTKIDHGIESKESNPVFNVVKPLLENLIQEIEKTLDFYIGMSTENTAIEKIILCGGGSNLKGLPDYLHERLGKEIELGNPLVNIKMNNTLSIIKKDNVGRYSTAIGLALRGFHYEKDKSNSAI